MDAGLASKMKPFESPSSRDFSDAKISDPKSAKALDSTANAADQVNFRDLLMNSNDDVARAHAAQKNGNNLRAAKTDEEFSKMMTDRANQGNVRKPQNELDKDAFLKLFVTQMRNQDPMNPDNSAQMAAQLAQFHGLEQMMNVNKNLEKMQAADSIGRAVGLINFVGKDIRLDNGKLQVAGGRLVTEASLSLEGDAVKTSMEVRDAAGALVATKDLGPLSSGDHKIAWDGMSKEGKRVSDGSYTFAVVANDVQGGPVDSKITSTVKVTGVDLHEDGGSFYTPLGKVRVNEVASVGNGGFAAEGKRIAEAAKDEVEGIKEAGAQPSLEGAQPPAPAAVAPEAKTSQDSEHQQPDQHPAEHAAAAAAVAPHVAEPDAAGNWGRSLAGPGPLAGTRGLPVPAAD